jgi:hypothetical protein
MLSPFKNLLTARVQVRTLHTMSSSWRPLSSRLSGSAGLVGVDWRDAIPPALEESLRLWLSWHLGRHLLKMDFSYYDAIRPHAVLSCLHLVAPNADDTHEGGDVIARLRRKDDTEARFLTSGTPIDLLVDIVDAVLHLLPSFADPLTFEPRLDPGRKELAFLLEDSPVLRIQPSGHGLERWSSVLAEEAFAEAVRSAGMKERAGSADGHLRKAWECVHAPTPDPVRAYWEAVKAVEAAAHAVLEPNNSNATLGSMLGSLRANPEIFSLAISGRDGRAGDTGRLIACIELLWKGQSARHGSSTPTRPETLEEATTAVHLAVMLVQWFTSGAVRRLDRNAS